MFSIKWTLLFLLIPVAVEGSVEFCKPAEIETRRILRKHFKLTQENQFILVRYTKEAGLPDTIGNCTMYNCSSLSDHYNVSIAPKKKSGNQFSVKIHIDRVDFSHDKAIFTWELWNPEKAKEKKSCQLQVYDFNSDITCRPPTLKINDKKIPEVLVSCDVPKVYPVPVRCRFLVAQSNKREREIQGARRCMNATKHNTKCTCNLTLSAREALVSVAKEVRFYFNIPKMSSPIIMNATINNTHPKVTVKKCSQFSTNATWEHDPERTGGYCRNLLLGEQQEETEDLCGPGYLLKENIIVMTQITNWNRKAACPEKIEKKKYVFDIYLANQGDSLSDVDIAGLTLRELSIKDKKIGNQQNERLYYRVGLQVLPVKGQDVAFRLRAYSAQGQHSLVECHTSLYEDCHREELSTSGPEGQKTTANATHTLIQPTITVTSLSPVRRADITGTTTHARGTGDGTVAGKGKSNRGKVGHAPATDVPDEMETFNIVVTSIPSVAAGAIFIIITICVVRYIWRRRRWRRRLRSRRNPPKSTTKSDEGTVIIQNDIYATAADTGISRDIATEEETLAHSPCADIATEEKTLEHEYAEVGDYKDVHANVQKLKNEDGGLGEGQYRNKDGLSYTTVDVISCPTTKAKQDIKEQPVEYAVICFPKE